MDSYGGSQRSSILVLEEQLSQWIDENAYLEVQTLLNILSL